jgi:general secretion pathway protein K
MPFQERALVEAGLHFMMLQLDNRNKPVDQNPWPVDGRLHPWRFEGHTLWIGAMPETGRIDLNKADDALLLGMLRVVGLGEEEATAVRDAILDWRDTDDGVRSQGAEDADYLDEGRPVGARDGRFMSVEELQQVKGVSHELYKKLEPMLTVDGGQRTVNPAFASRDVLSAVPDLDPELIDQYLLERKQALETGQPVPRPASGAAFFNAAAGATYRIFAEVEMSEDMKVQGTFILSILKKKSGGYQVLRQKWGESSAFDRAPAPEEED